MKFLSLIFFMLAVPSAVANELLAEVNSEEFAPTLFGYPWDVTENDLVSKGFLCSTFVSKDKLTSQRSCRSKNYRMKLDTHIKKFKSELVFILGDADSACAGRVSSMAYSEDFSESLIGTKLADDRYAALRKALARKFKRYESIANDISSDTGIPRKGYKLGEKISALLIKISDDYVHINISYRAQCFVEILLDQSAAKEKAIDSQL